MTLIEDVIRVVIVVLLVRMVLRFISSFTSSSAAGTRSRQASSAAPERQGGTLVRDPQCGTYVPESRAVALNAGQEVLHFCSTACRDAWQAQTGRPAARA
jgi:uncharacterized protein